MLAGSALKPEKEILKMFSENMGESIQFLSSLALPSLSTKIKGTPRIVFEK